MIDNSVSGEYNKAVFEKNRNTTFMVLCERTVHRVNRIICVLLAAVMMLTLSACGGDTGDPTAPALTEGSAPAQTEQSDDDEDELDLSAFIASFDKTAELEGQVVWDADGVKVEATGIAYDPISGPTILLSAENTTDRDLTIQADSVAVNGFMVNVGFSLNLPAQGKAQGSVVMPYASLALADIDRVATVELALRILDRVSYEVVAVSDTAVLVTTAAEGYEHEYDESGQTAYDANGVRLILKGIDESRLFSEGAALIVYMVNDTDKTVCVQAQNITVNGYEFTSAMSTTVLPSKRAVDILTFFDMDMEEYGIENIDSVELSFKIVEEDDWRVIDETDMITVEI